MYTLATMLHTNNTASGTTRVNVALACGEGRREPTANQSVQNAVAPICHDRGVPT